MPFRLEELRERKRERLLVLCLGESSMQLLFAVAGDGAEDQHSPWRSVTLTFLIGSLGVLGFEDSSFELNKSS